jgi:hypothetical protein
MTAVREALERTISSDQRLSGNRYAALVALCRVTADQVDQAGEAVSSRLIASYLSALKDLDKAMAASTTATAGSGARKKAAGDTNGSALGALRGIKGGKSA